MSKFLVDENLSPSIAEFLHSLNHKAVHVREVGLKGQPDSEIASWAETNNHVIITRDLDFGLTHSQSSNPPGIIILRSKKDDSTEIFQNILHRLSKEKVLTHPKLGQSLVIATPLKTRIVKL